MYKNIKQGWYKLENPERFVPPKDSHMKSFNESAGEIQYKSGLELKAFSYIDRNPNVKAFSIEPFAIKYLNPLDGQYHRYFVDMYIEFEDGNRFIVEIKPKSQVFPPKKPDRATRKSIASHKKAMETYRVNSAKWTAAREFARVNDMRFVFLTDEELKKY